MQYVTLVGPKYRVLSKSHIVDWIGLAIWCKCGMGVDKQDTRMKLTNQPECRGVCKSCERKREA
jgi:hypothetical protein